MQHHISGRHIRQVLFIVISIMLTQHAKAADQEIGAGLYMKPEYQGANEYQAVVLPSAKTTLGPVGVTLRGVELQLDLVPSPKLNFGFVVRYDEGRPEDVSDRTIRLMQSVDDALEAGFYLQSGIPVSMFGMDDPALIIGSIDVTDTFGAGHGGTLLSASLGILRDVTPSTTIISRILFTYADTGYNNAFFGVSQEDSGLSMLPEFKADKGIKDIGADLVISRRFDRHWSGGFLVSLKRFSADVADSPVISDRGSEDQWNTGLFTNYLF